MRLCLVGWGAIGRRVAELLRARDEDRIEIVAVAVRDTAQARDDLPDGARLIARPEELDGLDVDVVVEAAGRGAVAPWGEAAL
ncbi:aspartate dehydrogenase, partial [Nitratireductor sp. GCM10026969]